MKSYNYNSGTFIGKGGTEIFFQNWTVEKPACITVISHGFKEHSGRYHNLLEELSGKKISVYSMDHRGHGKSKGKRGHINSFMDYIYDLKVYIDLIAEECEGKPVIMLGHSMGGLISLKYALTYPEDLQGLILSSPQLMLSIQVPKWKSSLAQFLSKYFPSFTMPSGLKAEDLSHDTYEVDSYENDPLIHDSASSRWFTELTSGMEECLERGSELKLPLLVFHGKEDRIVDYRGSVAISEKSSSKINRLHIFEGLFHETMNETEDERRKVLQTVSSWISEITGKKKHSSKKTPAKNKKTPTGTRAKKTAGSKKKQVKKSR